MVKILFHDNCLSERGTTIALYDYAYYNKHYLKNESVITFQEGDERNIEEVIKKFDKEFILRPYKNFNEVDKIVKELNCDMFYIIKSGENDGKLSNFCKNLVHCVFNPNSPHGDVYASISPSVGNGMVPVVPHMINLPEHNKNLRKKLKIPDDSVVFGRYGGYDQFDIKYVLNIVKKIALTKKYIYFLFCNTKKFFNLPNIIYLDKIIDLEEKVSFINTCDAMLWARSDGETFGLSIGEFSIKNKPIICTRSGPSSHIEKLGEKAIIYNNQKSLTNILLNFNKEEMSKKDWNAYKDYTPKKVMNIFNEIFIKN